MHLLVRLASQISRALVFVGAVAVLLMMVHISADVFLRNVFRWSIPITTDIVSRYYMVSLAFLPLALLEWRNGMISVELLDFAISKTVLRVSEVLVALVATAVYGLLFWVTLQSGFSNYRSGTYVDLVQLQLPVWHSYFLPAIGFALAALTTAVKLLDQTLFLGKFAAGERS